MTPSAASSAGAVPGETILDVRQTSCCVVGAGPGGAMLALLLARKGVPVALLEAHKDFDRAFRGDTVHPSTLELLDEIGLADRLLELRHTKVCGPTIRAANGPFMPVDLRNIKTKFPYIMVVPQTNFLEFIVAEAKKFPSFRLIMNGNVQSLIEENGTVNGVRFLGLDGWHEVRATLTVGADGRFSRIRHLMGIQPVATSPPMDVLWFRLPRMPEDPREPAGVFGGFGRGHILVVRSAGLEELRRSIAAIEPQFTKHVEYLTDWQQCSLLSVESSFCKRWYKPGVLLIGDAAHVMSPVGGVGINYAIQDAVVAANLLTEPLRMGRVEIEDLAGVQRECQLPVRFIQTVQTAIQKRLIASVLQSQTPLNVPGFVRFLVRLPLLRKLPARLIGWGLRRVHVQ
jgi:2-polyprenyl-6-methoxyphenol hydroxylase-like FAD-dependent oxidoreductase